MQFAKLKPYIFTFIGALVLMLHAFINGFPIVYSDTSTYIVSGFILETPYDRPITYGLFIWLTSFGGLSLWLVALAQSWILSALFWLTISNFVSKQSTSKIFFIIVTMLSLGSVLPFVAGQIITDIFPAIGILTLLNLAFKKQNNKPVQVLLFTLFLISTAMHMSHLLLNGMLVIILFMIKLVFPKIKQQVSTLNLSISILLLVLSAFVMRPSLGKSKHVFYMGRMAENGILIKYLNEMCCTEDYVLCDCIDQIPRNTTDFLWDENSPVYTHFSSWNDSKEEFSEIIRNTLLTPKYTKMHIHEAFRNSLKQMVTFDMGDGNGPFLKGTELYDRITLYLPNDHPRYIESLQNKGFIAKDRLKGINIFYQLVIILSFLALLILYTSNRFRRKLTSLHHLILALILSSVVLNSVINASLVIVTNRFGAKLIWFIPFIALLLISFIWQQKTNFHHQHIENSNL